MYTQTGKGPFGFFISGKARTAPALLWEEASARAAEE
jgi:hypothetical protein